MITTFPTNTALTSAKAVAQQLGLTWPVDAATAVTLSSHILAASRAIEGLLRRSLALTEYEETVCSTSSRPTYLRNRPVRAADVTVVDADAGQVQLAPGVHTVRYHAGFDLPDDDFGADRDPALPPADPRYFLPADIQRAATILAASYWHNAGRDPAITREDVDGVSSVSYGTVGAQHDVQALLAPHRDFPVA